jgi:hypothetical protein
MENQCEYVSCFSSASFLTLELASMHQKSSSKSSSVFISSKFEKLIHTSRMSGRAEGFSKQCLQVLDTP